MFPYHAERQITLFFDSMITPLPEQQEPEQQENVMSQQSLVRQNGVLSIEILRDKETSSPPAAYHCSEGRLKPVCYRST